MPAPVTGSSKVTAGGAAGAGAATACGQPMQVDSDSDHVDYIDDSRGRGRGRGRRGRGRAGGRDSGRSRGRLTAATAAATASGVGSRAVAHQGRWMQLEERPSATAGPAVVVTFKSSTKRDRVRQCLFITCCYCCYSAATENTVLHSCY